MSEWIPQVGQPSAADELADFVRSFEPTEEPAPTVHHDTVHDLVARGPQEFVDSRPSSGPRFADAAPEEALETPARAPHNLTWEPGTDGKGFVLDDGSVWTWPTEDMRPRHMDKAYHVKRAGGRIKPGTAFHITPTGTLWQFGEGRSLDESDQAVIQDADRRLNSYQPRPWTPPKPEPESTGYGHGQNVYDILKRFEANGPADNFVYSVCQECGEPHDPSKPCPAQKGGQVVMPEPPGDLRVAAPWSKKPDYTDWNTFYRGWTTGDLGRKYPFYRREDTKGGRLNFTTVPEDPTALASHLVGSTHNEYGAQLAEMYRYGHIDERTLLGQLAAGHRYMNNWLTDRGAPDLQDAWQREYPVTPEHWQDLLAGRHDTLRKQYENDPTMNAMDYEDSVTKANNLARSQGVEPLNMGLAPTATKVARPIDEGYWEEETSPEYHNFREGEPGKWESLYHGTGAEHLPGILEQGIKPWDELGQHNWSDLSDDDWYTPRPGHTYLTKDPGHAYRIAPGNRAQRPVLEIDPAYLDPQHINPDEDAMSRWKAESDADEDDERLRNEWKQDYPNLGEVAEQLGWGDDPSETRDVLNRGEANSIAYRGTIPPHAIKAIHHYEPSIGGPEGWSSTPNPSYQPRQQQVMAGMTLPQEQRAWQQIGVPSPVRHSFDDGWTIRDHDTAGSINAVGDMMHNCWQSTSPASFEEHARNGWRYHSLHDEHGIPRAAFYLSTNPWSSRADTAIKQALGPRNEPVAPEHDARLRHWANLNGYGYTEPLWHAAATDADGNWYDDVFQGDRDQAEEWDDHGDFRIGERWYDGGDGDLIPRHASVSPELLMAAWHAYQLDGDQASALAYITQQVPGTTPQDAEDALMAAMDMWFKGESDGGIDGPWPEHAVSDMASKQSPQRQQVMDQINQRTLRTPRRQGGSVESNDQEGDLPRPVDSPIWSDPWRADPYLYHGAPTSERARIQTHGLIPSRPALNEAWEQRGRDRGLERQPEGVYFSPNWQMAHTWPTEGQVGDREPMDVWRVPKSAIKDWSVDQLARTGIVVHHPVQAELYKGHEDAMNYGDWREHAGIPNSMSDKWDALDEIHEAERHPEWGIGLPNRVLGGNSTSEVDSPNGSTLYTQARTRKSTEVDFSAWEEVSTTEPGTRQGTRDRTAAASRMSSHPGPMTSYRTLSTLGAEHRDAGASDRLGTRHTALSHREATTPWSRHQADDHGNDSRDPHAGQQPEAATVFEVGHGAQPSSNSAEFKPQTYFHVSPSANRDSITSDGLRIPDAGTRLVWLFPNEDHAREQAKKLWGGSTHNDVWSVDANGLDVTPDPHGMENAYATAQPVEPNRLRLASIPMTTNQTGAANGSTQPEGHEGRGVGQVEGAVRGPQAAPAHREAASEWLPVVRGGEEQRRGLGRTANSPEFQPPAPDEHLPIEQAMSYRPIEAGDWPSVRSRFEDRYPRLLDALRQDIADKGIVNPIQIDKQRGIVGDGHTRLLAAQDVGLTHVPVIYRAHAYHPDTDDWTWDPKTREHVYDPPDEPHTASAPVSYYRGMHLGEINPDDDQAILAKLRGREGQGFPAERMQTYPLFGQHWTSDPEVARKFALDPNASYVDRPSVVQRKRLSPLYGAVIEAHSPVPHEPDFNPGHSSERQVRFPHRNDVHSVRLHLHRLDPEQRSLHRRHNTYVRSLDVPEAQWREASTEEGDLARNAWTPLSTPAPRAASSYAHGPDELAEAADPVSVSHGSVASTTSTAAWTDDSGPVAPSEEWTAAGPAAHESSHAHSVEASGSQVYYHVAPRDDHDSVLTHGIDFNQRDRSRDWRTDDDDFEQYPQANYLTTDPSRAYDYSQYSAGNVYRINADGLTLHPDPDENWAGVGFYSPQAIGPERLLGWYDPRKQTEDEAHDLRTAMAERSGFPELDAAIEEFMQTHDVDVFRHPQNAWGACEEIADEFTAFLKQRGFKAYTTADELAAFPGYEKAQDSAAIGAGDFSYPEHAMVEVYDLPGMGVNTVTVDFTASQYGFTEFPKVHPGPAERPALGPPSKPVYKALGALTERTASGPSVYYHLAPTALREQIAAQGLIPASPAAWGHDATKNPIGVYLFPSVDEAEFRRGFIEGQRGPCDLWEVQPNSVEPDRAMAHSFVSTQPIGPERVRLMDQRTASGPEIYWHVSPKANRNSIAAQGLLPGAWGREQGIPDVEETGIDQPPSVYLFSQAEPAHEFADPDTDDVYEVDTRGLPLEPDAYHWAGVRHEGQIPPERVRLLDTGQHEAAVSLSDGRTVEWTELEDGGLGVLVSPAESVHVASTDPLDDAAYSYVANALGGKRNGQFIELPDGTDVNLWIHTQSDGSLILTDISASHDKTGIGTRAVAALREYAQSMGRTLHVGPVTNNGYWQSKWPELEPTGENEEGDPFYRFSHRPGQSTAHTQPETLHVDSSPLNTEASLMCVRVRDEADTTHSWVPSSGPSTRNTSAQATYLRIGDSAWEDVAQYPPAVKPSVIGSGVPPAEKGGNPSRRIVENEPKEASALAEWVPYSGSPSGGSLIEASGGAGPLPDGTARRYFHGSEQEFKPGDVLRPASETGYTDPWHKEWEHYDPSRVYMFDHRVLDEPYDHPYIATGYSRFYEVEPMGPVEPDPESVGMQGTPDEEWYHPYNWATPQARVIGEVPRDQTLQEYLQSSGRRQASDGTAGGSLQPILDRYDQIGHEVNQRAGGGWDCHTGANMLTHMMSQQGWPASTVVGRYWHPDVESRNRTMGDHSGDNDMHLDELHYWSMLQHPELGEVLLDPNGEVRGEPRSQPVRNAQGRQSDHFQGQNGTYEPFWDEEENEQLWDSKYKEGYPYSDLTPEEAAQWDDHLAEGMRRLGSQDGHRLWWKPADGPGRGLLLRGGDVWTWPETEGTHYDMTEQLPNRGRDVLGEMDLSPTHGPSIRGLDPRYLDEEIRNRGLDPEDDRHWQAEVPKLNDKWTEHVRNAMGFRNSVESRRMSANWPAPQVGQPIEVPTQEGGKITLQSEVGDKPPAPMGGQLEEHGIGFGPPIIGHMTLPNGAQYRFPFMEAHRGLTGQTDYYGNPASRHVPLHNPFGHSSDGMDFYPAQKCQQCETALTEEHDDPYNGTTEGQAVYRRCPSCHRETGGMHYGKPSPPNLHMGVNDDGTTHLKLTGLPTFDPRGEVPYVMKGEEPVGTVNTPELEKALRLMHYETGMHGFLPENQREASADDEEPHLAARPMRPGWRNGLIMPDGRVHVWPEEEAPHAHMAEALGVKYYDRQQPVRFRVDPANTIGPAYLSDDEARQILAVHPDITVKGYPQDQRTAAWDETEDVDDEPLDCPTCKGEGFVGPEGDDDCPKCNAEGFLPWLYHVAPTSERARIQTHGLHPSVPAQSGQWPANSEGFRAQPRGVYLDEDPFETYHAMEHMHDKGLDVWRVNPHVVTPQEDPIWSSSVYHPGPIAPEHISLARGSEDDAWGDRPPRPWAPGRVAAMADGHQTSWHLTDKHDFALDPNYHPDNNTTMGGDWHEPGIFVGNPERWFNGYNYKRPFVAEIEHPPLGEFGGYGGEGFLPAAQFGQSQVKRVIPWDEHVRETYRSPGHVEEHHGDPGLPQRFPEGYRYQGPDVRDMPPEEIARHKQRMNDYIREAHPDMLKQVCDRCGDDYVSPGKPCPKCGYETDWDGNVYSKVASEGPYSAQMWHGTPARNLKTVRPGFFATTHKPEAEDYAGVGIGLDPQDEGTVHPISVDLRNPKHYHGSFPGIDSDEVRALPQQGHDGLVVHFEPDERDPSSPMPARDWAYAFHPDSVSMGHTAASEYPIECPECGAEWAAGTEQCGFCGEDMTKLRPAGEHPDPWMDNEPGSLTIPEQWNFLAGWERVAGKLEWLQGRPDKFKDTPEGQAFMQALEQNVQAMPEVDPLVPWLWREARKGRITADRMGHFRFQSEPTDDPYDNGTRNLGPNTLSHWADWFYSGNRNPTRRGVDIMQLDVNQMATKIDEWDQHLRDQEALADRKKLEGGQVVHQLPNGWSVRKLGPEHLEAEGDVMGHCVGGYGYADKVRNGDTQIYSLRDHQHNPHATMELQSAPAFHNDSASQAIEYGLQHDTVGRVLPEPVKQALRDRAIGQRGEHIPGVNLDSLYGVLLNKYIGFATHDGPERGKIVQIQGKGNETPKPEYQAMLKDWLTQMPEDERPTWSGEREPINNIGQITGHDEYGQRHYDDEDDEENWGGYGPHGDYGIVEPPRKTDYRGVFTSLEDRARKNDWYVDPDDVRAVYEHARMHEDIPELARHLQDYSDQVQMPDWNNAVDLNSEHLNYPGESWDEEPDRWASQEDWQNAHENYRANEQELIDQHPPTQITNGLYDQLHQHWLPGPPGHEHEGEYRNLGADGRPEPIEYAKPQTFSHVPEDHQHRETELYSATDYLEDNRYRRRVTSDWEDSTPLHSCAHQPAVGHEA